MQSQIPIQLNWFLLIHLFVNDLTFSWLCHALAIFLNNLIMVYVKTAPRTPRIRTYSIFLMSSLFVQFELFRRVCIYLTRKYTTMKWRGLYSKYDSVVILTTHSWSLFIILKCYVKLSYCSLKPYTIRKTIKSNTVTRKYWEPASGF